MPTIVHEREGVLFLNKDGTYRGDIMVNGTTYELRGIAGKSTKGAQYIQLTAREHSSPAASDRSNPSPLPGRSARTAKLDAAMREIETKYRGVRWK